MDKDFFFNKLYPLQDRVLVDVAALNTGFYLTGGTASSRAYLHHRFSEDLDLFVNDDENFTLWSERIIHVLSSKWDTEIMLRETRFTRLNLTEREVTLKLELVNDVPSRIGTLTDHPTFGLLESPENILANKISAAIDRKEPKDLADIWGFCTKMQLSLESVMTGAQSKAAGIFPADLARVLDSASLKDWELVRWVNPPDPNQFCTELRELGEKLLLP